MTWTISPKMKAQIEAKAARQAIVNKQMEEFKKKLKDMTLAQAAKNKKQT